MKHIPSTDGDEAEVISAAVEIAQERSKLLSQIRGALQSGDEQGALILMRKYTGVTNAKENHRVN